jgi:transcriptional regulator with XRE-family HTH domain
MDLKVFYQELGKRLKRVRKTAGLTQEQIAKEIGLSRQYIIQIEKGKAIHPTLGVILNYLDACNVAWADFFVELRRTIDKIDYDQVINEVGLSSATGLTFRQKQKIDRDISYYRMRIDGRKGKAKPLFSQEKHRAAVKFGKYRIIIEPIEAEVQKKLGEINVPIAQNQAYKDFARECYSAIRKFTTRRAPAKSRQTRNEESLKEISALRIKLNQIIEKWVKEGLDRETMEIVKEIVISHSTS